MPRSPRDSRRSSPGELATALPGAAPLPTVKPFLQPFGILGPIDFVTLFLCLALGTAALPSLLVRSGVTSSIADQRRSSAWGLLFVAAVRHDRAGHRGVRQAAHVPDIAQAPASALPAWLTELSDKHLLQRGRRQWRRRDRRGRAARRARRHRAGAADGGRAALRAHRADGDGGHGHRARGVGLPSVHPGGEPRRGPLPRDRPPPTRCRG